MIDSAKLFTNLTIRFLRKSQVSYKGIIKVETSYTPWWSFFLWIEFSLAIFGLKVHQANAKLPQ